MKFRWYQRSLSLLVALVMLVQLMPGQCFAVGTDVFVDSTDIGDIIEESTNDTTAPPEQAEPAKVVWEDHSKTENALSYRRSDRCVSNHGLFYPIN